MGPGKDNVYKVQAAAEKDSLGGQNSMAYAEGWLLYPEPDGFPSLSAPKRGWKGSGDQSLDC